MEPQEKTATLYEWCVVNNLRLFDEDTLEPDVYMNEQITLDEFKKHLEVGYYQNTPPNKPNKYLELRMYGLVPYNLSPIQQGIQFNHANDEYRVNYRDDQDYLNFLLHWKTNILLNGGTSNEGHMVKQGFREFEYVGTMQQHLADLQTNDVKVGTFYEPDLNSMLTAIVFLVDERVFNKDLYPDFVPLTFEPDPMEDFQRAFVRWQEEEIKRREEWVSFIGGPKNEFLRDFLRDKRLA